MKYINSASLLHAIGADPSCGKCKQSRTDCMCQSLSRMDICGLVEDVPYEEIVHCGECKYFNDPGKYFEKECTHPHWDMSQGCQYPKVTDGDFCSYGEVKE